MFYVVILMISVRILCLFFSAAANPVKSLKLQIWDFKFHDQKVQNWKFLVGSARRQQDRILSLFWL